MGHGQNTRGHRLEETVNRTALYDAEARRRTVSLTLNADLCVKAKQAGINLSKVAEEALAKALAHHLAERMRAEIKHDLAAHDAFLETHGSFARMVRAHYAGAEDDAPV
jgi:post-segregation antitoxin (ccd killing protein)